MDSILFSSDSNEWATPQALFDQLDAEFHFTLDPCATPQNAKCAKYYTSKDDGLHRPWDGEVVFCNPPYGRQIGSWVHKAATAKATVVLLIPARTDTAYFHDWIYGKAELRFLRGRVHFVQPDGFSGPATFPSMLAIFRNGSSDASQTE